MKLEDMKIDEYMKEYAESEPSINFIISKKPRKREVRFLAKLLLRNAKHVQDNYLYQYTHVSENGKHVITFVCEQPEYGDGTTEQIINLSKFGQAFGITNEMIQEEVNQLIRKGALKLGNSVLLDTLVGPFEPGGAHGTGTATIRLIVQDRKSYRAEREAEAEQEELDRAAKEALKED